MTTFWVVAIALTVAVVALLAVPLAKRRSEAEGGIDQDRSNVALFQDQLHELERDRAQGVLSEEQFEQAKTELSQRLLSDVQPDAAARRPVAGGGPWRYAVLGCMPIAAVLGYLFLGVPEATDPSVSRARQGPPSEHAQGQGLDQLAQRLAERLQQNPDDTEAWVLLARSYQMLGRAPEAVKAFARSIELVPNSAQLHADYADVQIAANGGAWTDGARAAVARALELDPVHPKAIWLAGTDAFVRKDFAAALAQWEKLLSLVDPGSEAGQVVRSNIEEARSLLRASAPAAAPAAATATSASAATATAAAQAKPAAVAPKAEALKGTVALDPRFKAEVKPTDAVFVFARAAQGPRMPLAIRRVTVQDLPYAFSLDDAAAMAPGLSISKFDQIVVGARVSRTGDAAPKPGDLEGLSAPVKPGTAGIEVRIDARVQ